MYTEKIDEQFSALKSLLMKQYLCKIIRFVQYLSYGKRGLDKRAR